MEDGTEGWQRYIGKVLRVVYEDGKSPQGSPHYSTRVGELVSFNDTHIILNVDNKETGFNKQKILRFEEI